MLPSSHKIFSVVPVAILILACSQPQMLVYSAGFTFSRYDYLVFSKPEGGQTTALFGMDVELANMMARYNMKIVGDKEYGGLTPEQRQRTLFVRYSISTMNKTKNIITVSFDDSVTGKTVASMTSQTKGDLYKPSVRTEALEAVSSPLLEALAREKGLQVTSIEAKGNASSATPLK